METQKVKNKKIISLIYGVLTALLGLGGLLLLLSLILFVLSYINPDFAPFFPIVDIPLDIYEKGSLLLKNGTQGQILVDDAFISFNINEKYGVAGFLNYLYFVLMLGVAYYVIYLLWKIFKSIKTSLKSDNLFHFRNVWRIRLIAFAVLFSAILEIVYPMILKYFWFSKIIMFDKTFDIRLNFDASIDLFWALIILVVAEIYRIGLEIKKDQDLTI